MSERVAEVLGEIQLMSQSEKAELLRLLLLEVDGAADPDADEAWRVEIEQQVQQIHSGQAEIIPVEDMR